VLLQFEVLREQLRNLTAFLTAKFPVFENPGKVGNAERCSSHK
jgi:hypothetical protein